MALQPQNFPIILGDQGVDTKSDPKVVQSGKLLKLENARFTKSGTLSKKPGFERIADLPGGKRLATFKDELLGITSNSLFSYNESANEWSERGYISAVEVESKQIVRNNAQQSVPDVATLRNVSVYAWEDSRGGIRATVVDESSGLFLQADALISATGARPKVSANSDALFIHFIDTANAFKVRRLNPLAPSSFDAEVTLASDANATNPNFDISRHGNNLIFCYETTGNVVKTGYLKSDGDIGGVTDGFPAPVSSVQSGSGCVAICSHYEGDDNDAIYTFFHNTTDGLKCIVYSLDFSTAVTVTVDPITTVVNNITALAPTDRAYVWYEVNAAQTYNVRIKSDAVLKAGTVESSGTSTGTGNEFIRSLGLAGKAFLGLDENMYLVGVHSSTLQPTYFTLRHISFTRAIVSNNLAPSVAGGLTAKRSSLANCASLSDTEFLFPALIKARLVSEDGEVFGVVGVQSSKLTLDSEKLFLSKELGENLHIAGGLLYDYDGASPFEHGFNLFPENISNAINAGAGSISAGTRQYAVCYEWVDAQGQIHQSAPSIPLSVTNGANDRNTLTIPTLRLTEKKSQASRADVVIAVYRTQASGTIFYKVTSLTAPTTNSVTTDSVTVQDSASDATIASNQILYTTGGILENIQPPSALALVDYRERLMLGDLEDGNKIAYSKVRREGSPVNFSDALNFRVEQGGGRVTALEKLDEKLIIFKAEKALVQVGNGPTDTGAQDDFGPAQSIALDVGTRYPQSVVVTPLGLIFKSDKGYYLLDRSLQTSYIGADVEGYNALSVTGAILVSDRNEVRFTHSDGRVLIYDYEVGQWGTDPNLSALSQVNWQGLPVLLRSSGIVLKESLTSFKDAGSSVSMRFRTGWITVAGMQGAQRIYKAIFLGKKLSNHLLVVAVRYDYSETIEETFTFDSGEVLNSESYGDGVYYGSEPYYGGVDDIYQFEICPRIQQCQSVSFEVYDLNPEGLDGAGYEITGLTLVTGVKRGTFKLQNTKRLIGT